MTDGERTVPVDTLVAWHNELAGEFEDERQKLKNLIEQHGGAVMEDDPTFNYGFGRIVGIKMVLDGLRAYIATQVADQTGELDLLIGPIVDQVFEAPFASRENLGDPGI